MICLVHGIRSSDPFETMGGLYRQIQSRGGRPVMIDYGRISLPLDNGRARRKIRKTAKPGATLVGFSNGCYAIWREAARVKARHVILISPALVADVEWPECVETVTVFYCPTDWPVKLAPAWAWILNNTPYRLMTDAQRHMWGRMGRDGPDTDDGRVTAIRLPDEVGHSFYDHPEWVRSIAMIAERRASQNGISSSKSSTGSGDG